MTSRKRVTRIAVVAALGAMATLTYAVLPATNVDPASVPLGTLAGRTTVNVLSVDAFTRAINQAQGTNAVLQHIQLGTNQSTGWHTHPGPVILVIKTGTLTVYDASDPTCTPKVYTAGTAFFEGTTPHNVRNEGTVAVEYGTVYFVPAGGPTRIEADFPPNCPA